MGYFGYSAVHNTSWNR